MDKIRCAACGAEFDENRALPPAQRSPCPTCGSTARAHSAVLSDTASGSDSLTVSVIRPAGIESGEAFGTPTVAVEAQPATLAFSAHDATVHTEDAPTDAEPVEEALVDQGFGLWWHQLTASPVTWMAQVVDAAGEPLATVVGDDVVQMYGELAEWLLPHHPG
jgi:hypothetical protein